MKLIGSRAIVAQTKFYRPVKDWDLVATKSQIDSWLHLNMNQIRDVTDRESKILAYHNQLGQVEFEVAEAIGSAELLLNFATSKSMYVGGFKVDVIPLNILYLIKKAHINHPARWLKNIEDYHWLKQFETPYSKKELAFFDMRKNESFLRTPSLKMSNKEFFDRSKGINYEYPHDVLHWATCYGERPVFTMMKTDQTKAWCDEDCFMALDHETRLNAIREEAMVIALERYILPKQETDPVKAYSTAIMRICTTLTSGWFRDYAVEHWPEIKEPNTDYVTKFWSNLDSVIENGEWEKYF